MNELQLRTNELDNAKPNDFCSLGEKKKWL